MSWVKTIFRELIGLFVDDGSFAIAIVVWLGVAWFVLPRMPIAHVVQAPILLTGLLTILTESVLRTARGA